MPEEYPLNPERCNLRSVRLNAAPGTTAGGGVVTGKPKGRSAPPDRLLKATGR
ncbi:MAG: hypothetical protein H6R00_2641 [Proteobacteria bacterium]|nr:hypothetical protein [Pseudomonadota bacterium]